MTSGPPAPASGATGELDALTIGVSVPFFRRLDYLEEALRSLIGQTDRDWTAVVIDDASPEPGAAAVVEGLGDPRIRYVRNEHNLGLAKNFNRCLCEPGTQVVAVLHADDVLEPHYIATIRRLHAAAPDAALVAPMATAIGGDGRPVDHAVDKVKRRWWPREAEHALRGDRGLARLMHAFFVYSPAISYRPALLPERWFDDRWRQVMDVDLYARVLMSNGTIMLDRQPAYRYRRHHDTTTAQNERSFTRLHEETVMAREIAEAAAALGWRRTVFAARLRWSIRLNGMLAVTASMRPGPSGRVPSLGRLRAVRDVCSPR